MGNPITGNPIAPPLVSLALSLFFLYLSLRSSLLAPADSCAATSVGVASRRVRAGVRRGPRGRGELPPTRIERLDRDTNAAPHQLPLTAAAVSLIL